MGQMIILFPWTGGKREFTQSKKSAGFAKHLHLLAALGFACHIARILLQAEHHHEYSA